MAINSKAAVNKDKKFISPAYCCAWCGEPFERLKDAEDHENGCEIRGESQRDDEIRYGVRDK